MTTKPATKHAFAQDPCKANHFLLPRSMMWLQMTEGRRVLGRNRLSGAARARSPHFAVRGEKGVSGDGGDREPRKKREEEEEEDYDEEAHGGENKIMMKKHTGERRKL
jgi:hypothetical protein